MTKLYHRPQHLQVSWEPLRSPQEAEHILSPAAHHCRLSELRFTNALEQTALVSYRLFPVLANQNIVSEHHFERGRRNQRGRWNGATCQAVEM